MLNFIMLGFLIISAGASGLEKDSKFPVNPIPGKCYARVIVPATYSTIYEDVEVAAASVSVKMVPAKYKMVKERVVVQPERVRSIVIPAQFKNVRAKVVVEEEKRILKPVKARYKYITKRIQTKPEGYEWKKGKGPLQKVDHATGEILCYTKTPAVYKNIKERVLVSEASVTEKVIPAKYGFVQKRTMVSPERIEKRVIPEVTKVIRVRKIVEDSHEIKKAIPAKFKSVAKRNLKSPSYTKWQTILCQTNATRDKISTLQRKLARMKLYKGPIDGIYGRQTTVAVSQFQRKNRLATGGLTEETLEKLNITL